MKKLMIPLFCLPFFIAGEAHAFNLLQALQSAQGAAAPRQQQVRDAHTVTGDSIGGKLPAQRQQQAAPVPQQFPQAQPTAANAQSTTLFGQPRDFGIKDIPAQGQASEYRGFNGRTLEQAWYKCQYDAWRTAPPGNPQIAFGAKVRMRQYAMDSCMVSEGFFRHKPAPMFDRTFISGTDIFDIFLKQ